MYRLDLKLILINFFALAIFSALGLTGVFFLAKKEIQQELMLEAQQIETELTLRKHMFLTEILLNHKEALEQTIRANKISLGLDFLEFVPGSIFQKEFTIEGNALYSSIPLAAGGKTFGTLKFKKQFKLFALGHEVLGFVSVYLFAFCSLYLIFLASTLKGDIFGPISQIVRSSHPELGTTALESFQTQSVEIDQLRNTLLSFAELNKSQIETIAQITKQNAISDIAAQVSHDIRSPLSALTLMLGSLKSLEEDQRILLRSAVKRINDIANTLLEQSKKQRSSGIFLNENRIQDPVLTFDQMKSQAELVSALIDSLVSEKRIQYRNRSRLEIDFDLKQSYGLFAKGSGSDLKRILSNLINNSAEAIDDQGKILVKAYGESEFVVIDVLDNGKGIPPKILAKIGEKGVSFGKDGTDSGSGLGIYHAKQIIQNVGGHFEIKSSEASGTLARIRLPRLPRPSWFLERIVLNNQSTFVCVDDDISIHRTWEIRLNQIAPDVCFKSFTDPDEFRRWIPQDRSDHFFAIDFEFLGRTENGLDLIKDLALSGGLALVTSRYEELEIQHRCLSAGIKLVPKMMAAFVPIKVEKGLMI